MQILGAAQLKRKRNATAYRIVPDASIGGTTTDARGKTETQALCIASQDFAALEDWQVFEASPYWTAKKGGYPYPALFIFMI